MHGVNFCGVQQAQAFGGTAEIAASALCRSSVRSAAQKGGDLAQAAQQAPSPPPAERVKQYQQAFERIQAATGMLLLLLLLREGRPGRGAAASPGDKGFTGTPVLEQAGVCAVRCLKQAHPTSHLPACCPTGTSGVEQLVELLVGAEEANFSLFNYVNELNAEVEKLEDQVAGVRCATGVRQSQALNWGAGAGWRWTVAVGQWTCSSASKGRWWGIFRPPFLDYDRWCQRGMAPLGL